MILCMSFETDQKLRALRSAIDRAGLSLRRAARLVGIDNTVLTDWYNGERTPKSDKSLANLDRALTVIESKARDTISSEDPASVKKVGIRLVPVVYKMVADECLHSSGPKMIEMMDWGTDSERRGFVIPDDAMADELHLGQTIIADDSIKADPNHACLIETTDGERMVRWATGPATERVYRANDPQYAPYPAAKAKLLGVVVEVRTSLPGEEETAHKYRLGMRRKK